MLKRILNKLFGSELSQFKAFRVFFKGKLGLEIGGPSSIFTANNILPIYALAEKVDGCNFSTSTVWEGKIEEGTVYIYDKKSKPGYQYILEATNLSAISNETYDFIISSHSLEHIANPLKAVSEWLRILKQGGVILIVVPDKRFTFDHQRKITTFDHLLSDYQNNTTETDLTHLDEILSLHDLGMDKLAGSFDSFKERSLKNIENRCLHQHVFDINLLMEIINYFKVDMLFTDFAPPYHTIIMGRKK